MPHHTTHLAGAKFRPIEAREIYEALEPGGEIDLALDPTNQYDSNAVKVLVEGTHVGFIPAKISMEITEIVARGSFDYARKREKLTIEIHYDTNQEDEVFVDDDLYGDSQS
jgi:hypothetical protein